ncbi:MAG: hypothetical protein M1834_006568 [Cirrosporium novae-zelandiae]|nr:MAG: hypothetical protein M1834_006568 [Cirrosporium novae-zelandiae]
MGIEPHRKSNSLAHGLTSIGVKKGDRVAVSLGNNIEYAVATYALFKLGALLVPLNPAFNAAQVSSALNHLGASYLIIDVETNLPHKPPRSNLPLLKHLIPSIHRHTLTSELIPSLRHLVLLDNSSGRIPTHNLYATTAFHNLQHSSPHRSHHSPVPLSHLHPTETINIQFTSGTTSTPKAACLTHRNILNNGFQIGDRLLLTPKSIVCCPPPLFHCFGSILGYMATATHGSCIVFPSEAFNPLAALHAIQKEKCTALYGVPTMFVSELDLLENGTVKQTGFEQLRTGIAAGSSIPAALMQKLHSRLNLTDLTICYGMTETSPVSAMTTTDDPLRMRLESVGRPLPHVEVKVVDPGHKEKILPVGEKGEVAVSGYLIMKEYWNDEEQTTDVLIPDKAGKVWMHTGDEGTLTPHGHLKITNRLKDLIIRGGENIHPLEIENRILSYPLVSDVSVVGIPDERYGEVVGAFVICNPKCEGGNGGGWKRGEKEEEDVRKWVRAGLSHHLVPRYVFFVNEFPKTASGKVQKFKMREIGVEMLREREKERDDCD